MYIIVAFVMLVRGGADAPASSHAASNFSGSIAGNPHSKPLPTDFFSARFDHDLLRSDGSHVRSYQSYRSVTDRRARCRVSILELTQLLALRCGRAARECIAYPWRFLNSRMAFISTPLSELAYSPTVGVDYWIWALQISGVGSLLSGINFFITIIKMRCKGMTPMKTPIFVWSVLGSMSLVVFAFPILTVTLTLLALDRTIGTDFFTAGMGGNMMMYVNLIWAWGHPEVYILVLPAFGIFSEIVPVFSGKKLAGYTSMVFAIWAIVLLSFLVWLHHFFTMGAGADVNAFFGIMTAVIAVPTGVKMFNWLFTMYKGRIRYFTPMFWFLGFEVLFTLGGGSGRHTR